MMMETVYDPYEMLLGDGQASPSSDSLLFTNEVMLCDFNNDYASISSVSNTLDSAECDFDPIAFEAFLNDFLSNDASILKEQSMDLPLTPLEAEPTTREIGTDPMESVSTTRPITITTANMHQFSKNSIILIRTTNGNEIGHSLQVETLPLTTTTAESYNFHFETPISTTNDYQTEDTLPLTPSTLSESNDETRSDSPEISPDNVYSTLLTNFDNLPGKGPLVLTNEEVKLIKQEGYQVPNKLPLNKTEEKLLKKIRRKIKNKISAQESRRKKKEYVDALEKEIAKYVDENNALKERMATIEKNQKKLAKERDLLRSMMNKVTPQSGTVLMAFAVFFAVVFGIWAPATNKSGIDDRSLSLENSFIPSNNYQSAFATQKSLFEQQESTPSNYVSDKFKSRVLLSIDETDNHHYGPYLPSKNEYQSSFRRESAAPGYTYSHTVEKYMNKKLNSEKSIEEAHDNNFKQTLADESSSLDYIQEPAHKKRKANYHMSENFIVVEETNEEMDAVLNESKQVKIIRVERTIPAFGNDSLKLAHQTIDK